MKTLLKPCLAALLLAGLALLSCGKDDPSNHPVALPSSLTVSGTGTEFGSARAMVKVDDGVWDIYCRFKAGEYVMVSTPSSLEPLQAFNVPAGKDGICRLRVDAVKNTWELVKINKVLLVPSEGGAESVEAVYEGDGIWNIQDLLIPKDNLKYRYELDTDTPASLKYWCAVSDGSGTAIVRAFGAAESGSGWTFPADKSGMLAFISINLNASAPGQQIVYDSLHKGPLAVFIGDSITWQWGTTPREISKDKIVIPLNPLPSWLENRGNNVRVTWHPDFFSSNNYVDKGVSAETTTQMMLRYKRDVLDLDPHIVVIMGGTNDLAQGVTKNKILENISSMAEQAESANMKVILCSITPCNEVYSRLSNPNTKGAHILALNEMIKAYASGKDFTYCDYYPALAASDGLALKDEYCLYDRLHPNPDAYTVMEGIIKPIIDELIQ